MSIDLNKITIPNNYCLIKLDDDHNTYHSMEKGTDTGISVAPFGVNQASHLALTGIVTALPQRLLYHGYDLAMLKKDKMRSVSDQARIAELRRESMAYDVPMELEIGYRVYFEYVTRLSAIKEGRVIEQDDEKYIMIPYDQLVMAFKPGTNFDDVQVSDVYMLNGFLLIKLLEYAREKDATGVIGHKTESDLFLPIQNDAKYVHRDNLWYANVLAAGCMVKSYADFPERGNDGGKDIKPGDKISFDGRQKKRLEVEHHRVIFKKHELYRIHRKDVIIFYPDGKIS